MIFNPEDFGYDTDNCGLYIIDSGIHHGGLTGLADNDHIMYATGVQSWPLSYNNQTIRFHYDIDQFDVDPSGNLHIIGDNIDIHHGDLIGLGDNDHIIYATGVDGCPLSYADQKVKFNYDETQFNVGLDCKLHILGTGIQDMYHNILLGLDQNDHTQYASGIFDDPLSYEDQLVRFNYSSDDFQINMSGELELKVSDHNSLSGLQGGISGEYYHVTNTEHNNLHVPASVYDAPLAISGQEIKFNYDTDDFELDGDNLTIKIGGTLPSGNQFNTIRFKPDNTLVSTNIIEIYDDSAAVTNDHDTGTDARLTNIAYIASGDLIPDASGYAIGTVFLVYNP